MVWFSSRRRALIFIILAFGKKAASSGS